MQMILRVLREDKTAVKIIYLSAYSIVLSGAALAADQKQWTMPSAYQSALLVGCGADLEPNSQRKRTAESAMLMTCLHISWACCYLDTVFLSQSSEKLKSQRGGRTTLFAAAQPC